MTPVWTILSGSLLLSLIHAAIPNHWAPLVVIGKTENWTARQLAGYTAMAGFAHTASTVLIGIIVGVIGVRLAQNYALITRIVAPAILIALGVIYVVQNMRAQSQQVHHHHHHDHLHIKPPSAKTTVGILTSLAVAMFFSPCIEIEAYYFTASGIGWLGIWIVSAVYVVVTVLGMIVLTSLGRRGIEKIKSHTLEHHERTITGAILMVLGIFAAVVPL